MHRNFDHWRTWCSDNFDWDNQELCDVEYEPIWGTQYVRKMVQRHQALGFSNNGVAVVMLGYFFVYVHVPHFLVQPLLYSSVTRDAKVGNS